MAQSPMVHASEAAKIPAIVGNVTYLLTLISAIVYQIAVIGHFTGSWFLDSFGKHWAADAFCISFKDTLFHTHLLCFYGDTLFALILLFLGGQTRRSELLAVRETAKSVFFHGVAHLFLWAIEINSTGTHETGTTLINSSTSSHIAVVTTFGIFGFWVAFLCARRSPVPRWFNVAQSVVHTFMILWGVPLLLVFSYANTVISFNLNGTNLVYGLEGERDIFYALSAVMVAMPIAIAVWAEPLSCDSGLVEWGGHILFDFTIPLAQIMYFAVASRMPARQSSKKME